MSSFRKEANFSPTEIWGFWQCSVCVRQCGLWDLQKGRGGGAKFSPSETFPGDIIRGLTPKLKFG